MPRVTVNAPTEFMALVEEYQRRHDLKSASAAIIALATQGMLRAGILPEGTPEDKFTPQWGGDRTTETR